MNPKEQFQLNLIKKGMISGLTALEKWMLEYDFDSDMQASLFEILEQFENREEFSLGDFEGALSNSFSNEISNWNYQSAKGLISCLHQDGIYEHVVKQYRESSDATFDATFKKSSSIA